MRRDWPRKEQSHGPILPGPLPAHLDVDEPEPRDYFKAPPNEESYHLSPPDYDGIIVPCQKT